MITIEHKIILASSSPRRKELLQNLGLKFEVISPDIEEIFPKKMDKKNIAKYIAEQKALAVRKLKGNDSIIIAADSIVLLKQEIIGKPNNSKEAFAILSKLSGTKHKVITGVCIMFQKKKLCFSETSEVHLKKLKKSEINYYIENFKPYDKAGSYGIQEWIGLIGVKKINGDFYNVTGLPIRKVYKGLQKITNL